jgi:hypothetical protein
MTERVAMDYERAKEKLADKGMDLPRDRNQAVSLYGRLRKKKFEIEEELEKTTGPIEGKTWDDYQKWRKNAEGALWITNAQLSVLEEYLDIGKIEEVESLPFNMRSACRLIEEAHEALDGIEKNANLFPDEQEVKLKLKRFLANVNK